MVDAGLIGAIRDLVHLSLHFYEFTGFGKASPHCPDCVCGACVPLVQEKVSEAITSALAFAQAHCLSTISTTTSSALSSGWSFNLFWWGCLAGFVVTSSLWVFLIYALRCLRSTSSTFSSPPNSVPTLSLRNLIESEPANPTRLRELGLIR